MTRAVDLADLIDDELRLNIDDLYKFKEMPAVFNNGYSGENPRVCLKLRFNHKMSMSRNIYLDKGYDVSDEIEDMRYMLKEASFKRLYESVYSDIKILLHLLESVEPNALCEFEALREKRAQKSKP